MAIVMNKYFDNLSVVYIEVTNKCNINCKYCYEIQKKDAPRFFTVDLFRQVIDQVAQHSVHPEISIIFHGGEPLLVSNSFFAECFAYATEKLASVGKKADFGLQSNLLQLTDELIPLLKEYKVSISTSIDGFENVHNQARFGWSKTIANLAKLLEAKIKVNFISVCSQHNYNHIKDIFLLAKEYGFASFQLNIASSVSRINPQSDYMPLTEQQIFDIYTQSLDFWKETGVQEKNMATILRRFFDPERTILREHCCESPFCYAGLNMLVFTPDGKMHMCSPAVPMAKENPEIIAGEMTDLDNEQRRLKALSAFHAKDAKYENECMTCEASAICNFGCPAFDRIDPQTAQAHCEAVKRFYDYLLQQDPIQLKQLINVEK